MNNKKHLDCRQVRAISKSLYLSIFTFIFAFLHTFAYAGGETEKELPQVTIEATDDQKPWRLYNVSMGELHFSIRFPKPPTIQYEGIYVTLYALDTTSFPVTIYGISFRRDCAGVQQDPDDIFHEVLSQFSQYPHQLLTYRKFQEEDFYYLELVSKHLRYEVYRKELVIVSPFNIFSLYSVLSLLSPDNSSYFFNSFLLALD